MSAEKIIESWKQYLPPEVPKEDVLSVIESKFEHVKHSKRGSHWEVYDSRFRWLEQHAPQFVPDCTQGNFTVPIKNGRIVKKHYVSRILKLIDMVERISARGIKP